MHEHEYEQFTPEHVDEQIEALSQQEHSETGAYSPNAHLVSNLREAYQQDKLIVERVWTLLTEQIENQDTAFPAQDTHPGRVLDLSAHQRKEPSPMNYSIGTLQKKTHPFQRITTLVAILFIIALVGSFVIVTRLAQHAPATGSHTVKPVLTTPTHTQTVAHGNQSGLYVATTNGIARIDLKTGKTLWHAGSGYNIKPAVSDGTVYASGNINSGDNTEGINYLDAINASNGTVRWHKNYPAVALQVANDLVYNDFCTQNTCSINALNTSNGAVRWTHSSSLGSIWMTVQNGVVYGTSYTYLFALNARTGIPIWQSTLQIPDQNVNMEPLISNGVMYFASCNITKHSTGPAGCYLYAYNATNGKEIWHYHATETQYDQIIASPIIAGNIVYFGTINGLIGAVDSKTGNLLWHYNTGNAIVNPLKAVASTIYAETVNNNGIPTILALDTANRTVLWTKHLPPGGNQNTGENSMIIFNGLLYTISGPHNVVALSLQNGTQVQLYRDTDNVTLNEITVVG